jgi:hypothetical protein
MAEQSPATIPAAEELQFKTAIAAGQEAAAKSCVACKQPVSDTYFHAQGQVVCAMCASRIEAGQQAPPAYSLLRAVLYGAGAALAGCAIYATVALVTGLEIGLIAILVGVMVGKAIRHASRGQGGRAQQVLAVALTYFAITTSYIPVFIKGAMQKPKAAVVDSGKAVRPPVTEKSKTPPMSFGQAVAALILLAAAAPFLTLGSDISGLLSLFIIFLGLRQAWKLTGRSKILVMGPYPVTG